MTITTRARGRKRDERDEYVDVLIVGAGISGIGTASRLKSRLPDKSFLILDARENIGGTWDLFRYPGLRSDTDAQNFGYESKPWRGEKALADGSEILGYLQETVAENNLAPHLRLGWKALAAEWSSEQGLWTVQLSRSASAEASTVQCRWLFGATGYYDHEEGHRPHFETEERFQGQIIHPQHWPDDLDYTDKKVVIIGSGATAITLVPAMAPDAAQVTMLQRSPTYVISLPSRDVLTVTLQTLLPEALSYRAIRRINRDRLAVIYALSRRYPDLMRALVRWTNKRALPKGYPVDEHFRPHYNPWEERMCFARDADFFKAISDGSASVVTGQIARFTEHGVELTTGDHLEADIIVTATGLRMMPLRAMALTVDGAAIDVADTVIYKSMMLSGVPNFAFAFGYTNAAWTLKVDLVAEHLCRLLAHMDSAGQAVATPVANDPTLELTPMVDFRAGYVQRAMDTLPRRGSHGPWSMEQDYRMDRDRLLQGPLEDPALRLSSVDQKNHLPKVS
ncbi:flavin-containing monooxygenase [Streptomyces bobili]